MLNKAKIKESIIKAIKIMPTEAIFKRIPMIPDGMNGFKKGNEITVATVDGLLDDGSATRTTQASTSDGGNVESITHISLLCPAEDKLSGSAFQLMHDDYFQVSGTIYKILQPNLVYGIYWMCTLEVDC